MKTIIKCPHSGQTSSKRVISLLFALVAAVGTFVPYVEGSVVITLATLAIGGQALTKNLSVGSTKIE